MKEKEKKWEEEKEINDRIKTLERVFVRVIKNRGNEGEEGK